MKKQMSILLAGAAACAVAAPALAQQENQVRNEQRTWAETRAELNGHVRNVTEGVSMTAAAIGNSFSAELGGSANVSSYQWGNRDVSASMYLDASDTLGSIEATTAAIGNSASISIDAFEGDGGSSRVSNTQIVSGAFHSNMTFDGSDISGVDDVAISATSASIANSLNVNARGDVNANNFQRFWGDSRSVLNAGFEDVAGSVEFTSAALGNSASFDVEEAGSVQINNTQYTNYDPQAFSNIEVGRLEGDFTSTTAAISNSLSVSTLPATASLAVNNRQMNRAYTGATANIHLGDVVGSASVTAAAIANSASISNLPDGF
ncbi:hypothetical protein NHF45_10340 [Maricaulaceae bacterium NA33B04]|nr:hypothetical protein [Maricaulaceae bacterium NA33B04]